MTTPITCTRRIQFAAGHRVYQHESKCAHLHGHNYVVLVTAQMIPFADEAEAAGIPEDSLVAGVARGLDKLGRVIDFSVLKERIGGWIDQHWDHGMILWAADPIIQLWQTAPWLDSAEKEWHVAYGAAAMKHFVLPHNPTAENMARYLLEVVGPEQLKGTGVRLVHVRVWETENCYADAGIQP